MLHNNSAFKCLRFAILPLLLLVSIDRSAAASNSRIFTEHLSNLPSSSPTSIDPVNHTSNKPSSDDKLQL